MEPDKEIINIIIRQTNYNENEAKQKLIEHDNNYLEVIKNYMNPSKIKNNNNNTKKKKTTNQLMYGEFRNLMDDASRNYRIQKEKEDKINQIIGNIKYEKEKEKNNISTNEM